MSPVLWPSYSKKTFANLVTELFSYHCLHLTAKQRAQQAKCSSAKVIQLMFDSVVQLHHR